MTANQQMDRFIRPTDEYMFSIGYTPSDLEVYKQLWDEYEKEENGEHLYLINAVGTDRYKIGYSAGVEKRIKGIQTDAPYELELVSVIPGKVRDERALHKRFAKYHVIGEWFCFPEDSEGFDEVMTVFIDGMIDGFEGVMGGIRQIEK